MSADVAIAIVSYNTRELLDACLTSLRAEHEAGRAEVWVVDNDSSDGSADMVRERHPWVQVLALRENPGYGAAVNLVAERTHTPYVAAANADLRFEPHALERLLDAARASPEAGALAPRLVMLDGSTQHTVHPFPTLRVGLALSLGLHRVPAVGRALCMEGHWDPDRPRGVDWAHGAFLLVPREAWDAVGGFDPEQWLYAEDLDLCWRLHRAGRPTRYVPDAVVHHHVSAATSARWTTDERAVRTQRAAYAWMLARRGAPITRVVALANLAGPVVRWLLWTVAAPLAPRRAARHRRINRGYARMHRTGLEPGAELLRFRSRPAS